MQLYIGAGGGRYAMPGPYCQVLGIDPHGALQLLTAGLVAFLIRTASSRVVVSRKATSAVSPNPLAMRHP